MLGKLLAITLLGLFLVGIFLIHQPELKEDISSYNIKDRHECYKIQSDKKYNDCLAFYLEKVPYKLNEKLIPIRRTVE